MQRSQFTDAKKTQTYAELWHTFKKNSGCNEIISVDRHCKRRSDSSVHPSLAFALWHLPPIAWIENSRTIFGGEESASEPFHAEERCRYILQGARVFWERVKSCRRANIAQEYGYAASLHIHLLHRGCASAPIHEVSVGVSVLPVKRYTPSVPHEAISVMSGYPSL